MSALSFSNVDLWVLLTPDQINLKKKEQKTNNQTKINKQTQTNKQNPQTHQEKKKKKLELEVAPSCGIARFFFTVCLHLLTSTHSLRNRLISTPTKCSHRIFEMAVLKKNKPGSWACTQEGGMGAWHLPPSAVQSPNSAANLHPKDYLLVIKDRGTLEHTGSSSSGSSPTKLTPS